jgi:hypothetical protein
LLVTDYDVRRAVLSVTKARVPRRDKDRTKTQEDRDVELCPRALEVLRRHLALRDEYVAAGKIRHSTFTRLKMRWNKDPLRTLHFWILVLQFRQFM